jgi:hypothetical protein
MVKIIKLMLRAVFIPWKNADYFRSELTSGLWTRAFLGLIFFGIAFSLTSLIQAATGNFPGIPLILPLSLENYFVWQAILIIPWLAASWILVSLLFKFGLAGLGARAVSFRQLSASMAINFYPFLFWLWLPHCLTALFYLLGMSQKEWVDLLSEPGWFQSAYIIFIILAILVSFLATIITFIRIKWAKKGPSLILAVLSYISWVLFVLILLR